MIDPVEPYSIPILHDFAEIFQVFVIQANLLKGFQIILVSHDQTSFNGANLFVTVLVYIIKLNYLIITQTVCKVLLQNC